MLATETKTITTRLSSIKPRRRRASSGEMDDNEKQKLAPRKSTALDAAVGKRSGKWRLHEHAFSTPAVYRKAHDVDFSGC